MTARSQLFDITRALIDIPSVSEDETVLLDHVKESLPTSFHAVYDEDSVALFAQEPKRSIDVLLVGHTDTVPIADNVPAVVSNNVSAGRELVGRGASDMKGGLAVMLCLAKALDSSELQSQINVGLLFFGREELPATRSALVPALKNCTSLQSAGFAILLEPTTNSVELGCQGNLNIDVSFNGLAAHSARPWLGDNAIHKAIGALAEIASASPNDVDIDGLVYREVASVTNISGGHARNVIPDNAKAQINVRYSPSLSASKAADIWTQRFADSGATITVAGNAPGALPNRQHQGVQMLIALSNQHPTPKQAWTNVADFAAIGVPAVNFGPGDPALAHCDNEAISENALIANFDVLSTFLAKYAPPDKTK